MVRHLQHKSTISMMQNRSRENLDAVMTLEEVAKVLGISVARVRQIERRAMVKLLFLLRKRGLGVGDFVVGREDAHPLTRTCI